MLETGQSTFTKIIHADRFSSYLRKLAGMQLQV